MNATLENLIIRTAREDDLPALAAIFAADEIGGHGDTADESAQPDYLAAFRAIEASPSETLYGAELDGVVVGTAIVNAVANVIGPDGKLSPTPPRRLRPWSTGWRTVFGAPALLRPDRRSI